MHAVLFLCLQVVTVVLLGMGRAPSGTPPPPLRMHGLV